MSNASSTASPLPSGWEVAEISKVARVNPALDCPVPADEDTVNFVPMRAVEPEGGGLLRPEVRPYREVKKGYTAFQSGDVIMAKITPCMENGKITVVPELPGTVCFGSTEFHVLRAETGIEPKWFANFLLQHEIRRAAQRKMTGGVGQMRVPATFLENVNIPIAPSVEQQRITDTVDELLSDLEAGVGALQRVQKRLAHYRAAVLKAAVEGALTEDWRGQHSDSEPADILLARILDDRRSRWEHDQRLKFVAAEKEPPKDWRAKYKEPAAPDTSSLPALPEGWCWTTLDQLCFQIRNGYSLKPNADRGVPILRISSVRPLSVDLTDVRYLSGTASDYAEFLVATGDLLFTRYNGTRSLVAVCGVAPEIESPLVHPDKLIRARMGSELTLSAYVGIAANAGVSRKFLESKIRTTAGQAGVSGSDIRRTPIPLPPLIEQQVVIGEVENQLSVVDHLKADLESKLRTSMGLRQAIFRDAFGGQLEEQDPSDEPASELLRRIASEREKRAVQSAATEKSAKQLVKHKTAQSRKTR